MRTTVEISEEQRSALAKLAAERGEKGFSRFVQEALEAYLARQAEDALEINDALSAIGSLSEESASRLREHVKVIRGGRWR